MAELAPSVQLLRTSYRYLLTEYEEIIKDESRHEELSTVGYAVKMNNLKLAGSQMIVDIANKALQICGVLGYKNDSKFAMGRILRDSHAAALMVGNDRILNTNANMLMILKGD
jgi:acyl-CoA dehydrogenase